MSQHAELERLTPEEYLALERQAEQRSEYYAGEMFLLAGASRPHGRIASNIVIELGQQLADRDCDIYASDLRVLVERSGLYTYPDIVVTCGEERFADDQQDVLLNPLVLFEILSRSTEAYDRGRKFEHYQRLDSLAEYVLVAQDTPRIEHFARRGDGWLYTDVRGIEGVLELPAIACDLPLADVYRRVPFGPARLR